VAVGGAKYQLWLTPDGLTKITGYARDGMTDAEIAKAVGVGEATLYRWKNSFPAIADALAQGKEIVDYRAEETLLRRAMGYTYTEVTREPNKSGKLAVTKSVTKEVAPDVAAAFIWLKNRQPKKWRNNPESGSTGGVMLVDDLKCHERGNEALGTRRAAVCHSARRVKARRNNAGRRHGRPRLRQIVVGEH